MSYDKWDWDTGSDRADPWEAPKKSANHGTFEHQRHISRPLIIVLAIIPILIVSLIIGGVIFSNLMFEVATPEPDYPAPDSGEIYDLPPSMDDFFDSYFTSSTGSNELEKTKANPNVQLTLTETSETQLSFQALYAKCSPSIVGITTELDGYPYGWGTGIIFSSEGYIITNSHVLDGTDKAIVSTFDGEQYEAKLVGYDNISDLAVIKIEANGLTPAEFGNSDDLVVGDAVVAIGNPLGEELRGTMTDGIISAINRDIYSDGNTMSLLQTNAAINGGNSGGALIDMSGKVIGVTNMKMTSYYDTIEGIGFAIPTSVAKPVVDSIMANGYVSGRPAIGVTVGGIPEQVQSEYGVPAGAYVSSVTEGSGADVAGIMQGDIITHANGIAITTSDELNEIKADFGVGDEMILTIWRDGDTLDIPVPLMETADIY